MMMRFYNSRVEHIVTKTMSFLSSVTTLLFFIVIVIKLRRKTPMLASGFCAAFYQSHNHATANFMNKSFSFFTERFPSTS